MIQTFFVVLLLQPTMIMTNEIIHKHVTCYLLCDIMNQEFPTGLPSAKVPTMFKANITTQT